MIGSYELDELLSKYGVDASKVVRKNDNVLTYGEYQEIKNVLEFLVRECEISPRNIEKAPSILFYNTQNIRENYEFLKNSNVNLSNVETTLHVLCANPSDLKETYKYILDNYGIEYINRTTSILRVNVDRIKQIEKILNDKSLVISAAISLLSVENISKVLTICRKYNISVIGNVFFKTADEIERIIKICEENNIPIVGNVFRQSVDEIEKIIRVCKKNSIPIMGNVFRRTADEIEQIIIICNENNIPITGSVFQKNVDEIKKIIAICQENNIPITGSVFLKTADAIEKIIKVCRENNIPITGSIFIKTAEDLQASIDYVKNTYGQEYLVSLVVSKNVKHLQKVLPYLDSLDLLSYIIESASILRLTLEEIMERKEYIESQGESLITKTGRFNSIFGLSRKNYEKLAGVTR